MQLNWYQREIYSENFIEIRVFNENFSEKFILLYTHTHISVCIHISKIIYLIKSRGNKTQISKRKKTIITETNETETRKTIENIN